MSDPLLQDSSIHQNFLGYRISDSDEVVKAAMERAFQLVREARRHGSETRLWAANAANQIQDLILRARTLNRRRDRSSDLQELEKKLSELNGIENKILQVLRYYIGEITSLNERLQILNPPLSSEQVKSFIEAVAADRRTTILSIEPLTKGIEILTAIKARIRLGSSGSDTSLPVDFNPAA